MHALDQILEAKKWKYSHNDVADEVDGVG